MELPEFVKTLQKEFDKKVVIAERMADRRGFIVKNSLDNKVEIGKPLSWHNLKDLSEKGYATVLYDSNLNKREVIRASTMDEINCIKIRDSPNENIPKGLASFRDIYDYITIQYPTIISDKSL